MTGMIDLVTVDGPSLPTGQLRELDEPVWWHVILIEPITGTGGNLGDQRRPSAGMERAEPSGSRELLDLILAGLRKITAGIPLPKDAKQSFAQEAFVAEFWRIPPVPAMLVEQTKGWGEKVSLAAGFSGSFSMYPIVTHTWVRENKTK